MKIYDNLLKLYNFTIMFKLKIQYTFEGVDSVVILFTFLYLKVSWKNSKIYGEKIQNYKVIPLMLDNCKDSTIKVFKYFSI